MVNNKPRIRVAVLIRTGDNVLLVKHCKYGASYWLLPGGGLEFGETIEECARRELLEETGLEVTMGDLLFVSESIPPDLHRHVVNLYYEGEVRGGELTLGDDDVLAGVEYVPIDTLPTLDLRPPVTREILDYLCHPDNSRRVSLGNRWDNPTTSKDAPAL